MPPYEKCPECGEMHLLVDGAIRCPIFGVMLLDGSALFDEEDEGEFDGEFDDART